MADVDYDEPPPSYDYDETSGVVLEQETNVGPSAPPNYNDLAADDTPLNDEGVNMNQKQAVSQLSSSYLPQRSIYIVKMPHEAVPIITVITPDLIPQYSSEHIVYPKTERNTSQMQVIQPILASSIAHKKAFRSTINSTNTAPLSTISSVATKRTKRDNIDKITYSNTTNIEQQAIASQMFAHNANNDEINRDKRIPSEIANKYNLMYGRMNLLLIVYVWIIFIMMRLNTAEIAQIMEYCHSSYPSPESYWNCDISSADYISCGADPICAIIEDDYQASGLCSDGSEDCECCANVHITGSKDVNIAFYVFLGINTFRLFFISFALGMKSINKVNPSIYVTDSSTNKVQLQQYMDYLCDHPASYILCIFYSDANRAIKEAIVYNIAFPITRFLYLNVVLFYIPFFVLISLITDSQINLLLAMNDVEESTAAAAPTNIYGYAEPTMYPTTIAPTISTTPAPTYYWQTTTTTKAPFAYSVTANLLITCVVGLILMLISFIMQIYRWKTKNKTERTNLKQIAIAQSKQIAVPLTEDVDESKRKPSEIANKWNLMYRWINLCILIYLWLLFAICTINYGWFVGDYGACIAYIVFLALHSMRLMIVALFAGILIVDNEYNYILNPETQKVQLRTYMDHLCDHPSGLIIAFLYDDVAKALHEALIYNITFPETRFLAYNILTFYVPMMIITAFQAPNITNEKMWLLYTIAAMLCSIGIISNSYRFKMKNDIETINSNI